MTKIQMRRNDYCPAMPCEHAGLFLLKGFKEWRVDDNTHQEQNPDGNHNKDIAVHHKLATKITIPSFYEQTYGRWKKHLFEEDAQCGHYFGKLTGRLYLGLGEASPLEAGITLHHTYGVPFIPGTAVKGVLRHFALANGMDKDNKHLMETIFGAEPDPKNNNSGEAGCVIFNDAWWIPGSAEEPLAPEVITVHHPDYYKSDGAKPATDFDDPNPNPQIAIQGSFHFSFLAHEPLHPAIRKLLKGTLQHSGIGGKTSSGYGVFCVEDPFNEYIWGKYPRELLIDMLIEQIQQNDISDMLGKDRNKTAKKIGQDYWDRLLNGIEEKFNDEISAWENSDNKNQKRACKTIKRQWTPQWAKLNDGEVP